MAKRFVIESDTPGTLDPDEVTTPTIANGAVTAAKADVAGASGDWVFAADKLRLTGFPTIPSAVATKAFAESLIGGVVTVPCPGTVSVGDVVRVSGADLVDRADASAVATMPVVAFVSAKPTGTTATLWFAGALAVFSGLTPGAEYFVDVAAGAITTNVAGFVAGNVVQRVGVALNGTTLLVNISSDFVEL